MFFLKRATNRAYSSTHPAKMRVPILDLEITPISIEQLLNLVTSEKGKRLVVNHNLHSAYLHEKEPSFSAFYKTADAIVIDGFPILALAWITNPRAKIGLKHRFGSTDWIARLTQIREPMTLAVLGASQENNELAIERLQSDLPHWRVVGLHGFTDDQVAISWLSKSQPDLVIVGQGMPRQEKFLADNWPALPDATYATVGGAIDYIAGSNPLAPRWMGRLGLEWIWRLVHEPLRLADRYLMEPFKLARLVSLRVLTPQNRSADNNQREWDPETHG